MGEISFLELTSRLSPVKEMRLKYGILSAILFLTHCIIWYNREVTMNQIWFGLIAVAFAITAGYLISLIIELKKALRTVNDVLKTTEENLKPTLEEIQQTLRSLRNVSDDINEVTSDVKTLSGSVRDVGLSVKQVNNLIGNVASLTAIRASGVKAGLKVGLGVLMNNLFSKIGGNK